MEKSQKHSAFSCIFMQLQLLLTNFECSAQAWRMDFFGSHSGIEARTFRSAPNPTADPAERIAVGKEERRHKRALPFEKSRSKRYRTCSDLENVNTFDARNPNPYLTRTGIQRSESGSEAKKFPVRLRSLASRRGFVPNREFLSWCRWWDSNPHTIAGNGF